MRRPVPGPRAQPLLRVVIADGDADTRSMYREALRPLALDIIEVDDGRDALVQCLIEPPALLIADTQLSSVDGYALCHLLRRDGATRAVPILTAYATETCRVLSALLRFGTIRPASFLPPS